MDDIDRKILRLLQENGRISFAEIGRQVGLSLPAAAERVRRLEDAGIIEGYQAILNPKKLGHPTTVFVQLTIPNHRYQPIIKLMREMPEILEAHHVAGELSFILKLQLSAIEALETILLKLNQHGETNSIIVLSTAIKRPFAP